mgnify:CR=1 FL=1
MLFRSCNYFGVTVKDYSIGLCSHSYWDTNASNEHFRGLKLKDIKRDKMLTGYYLDSDIWETFYDTWKETGSALKAFNLAIGTGVKHIIQDMEYLDSDEAIDESLIVNGYEFYENGKIYH